MFSTTICEILLKQHFFRNTTIATNTYQIVRVKSWRNELMSRFLSVALLSLLVANTAHADLYSASTALSRGDYETAVAEFTRLAEKGDDKAQANLGYLYYAGEGVAQDYKQAVYWYRMAAVQGNKDAQYNLAVSYAFGEGVEQDLTEAAIWYRRAGEQGHVVSQYSLGISYAYGEGVPQDQKEAARWFKKAADQGYSRAQVHLGSMYHTGEGVEQDYAEAVRWYRMAADRGDATAQYNLGAMYRSGNGVEQNYAQAKRWYRQSADQGYAAAQNELASLERSAGANVATRTVQVKPELFPTETAVESIAEAVLPETPVEQPIAVIQEPVKEQVVNEETTAAIAETEKISEVPTTEAPVKKPLFTVDKKDLLTLDESTLDKPEPIKEGTTSEPAADTEVEQAVVAVKEETSVAAPIEPEAKTITTDEVVANNVAQQADKPQVSPMHRALGIPEPKPQTKEEKESGNLFGAIGSLFSGGKKSNTEQVDNVTTDIESNTRIPEKIEEHPQEISSIGTEPEPTVEQKVVEEVTSEEPYVAAEDPTLLTELTPEISAQETVVEEVISEDAYDTAKNSTLLTNTTPAINEQERVVDEISSDEAYIAEEDPTLLSETTANEVDAEKPKSSGGLFSAIGSLFSSKDKETETAVAEEEPQTVQEEVLITKVDEPAPVIEEIGLAQAAEQDLTQYSVEAGRRALANSNYDAAVKQFRPLAEAGDSEAQAHIGSLYYTGSGVEQNYDSAFSWYKKAADQDNVDAQYSIGNMYLLGEGVEQSNQEAAKWYALASEKGHVAAQNNLQNLKKLDVINRQKQLNEEMADEQKVVEEKPDKTVIEEVELAQETAEQDLTQYSVEAGRRALTNSNYDAAVKQFRPLAEAGDSEAQAHLGSLYYVGKGVEHDVESSFSWYKKAADQGNVDAQYSIGNMYLLGEGIEQSNQEAAKWYAIASEKGHVAAQNNLQNLKKLETLNRQNQLNEEALAKQENTEELQPTLDDVIEDTATETTNVKSYAAGEAPSTEILQTYADIKSVETDIDAATPVLDDSIADDLTTETEDPVQAIAAISTQAEPASEQTAFFKNLFGDSNSVDTTALKESDSIDLEKTGTSQVVEVTISDTPVEEKTDEVIAEAIEEDAVVASEKSKGLFGFLGKMFSSDKNEDNVETKVEQAKAPLEVAMVETKSEQTSVEDEESNIEVATIEEQIVASAPESELETLHALATKGDMNAQYKLGTRYYAGDGVIKDYSQSALWYRRSAEQGNIDAQYSLGNMYLMGEGIAQDDKQATHWYALAADQGHVSAQHNLTNLQKTAAPNVQMEVQTSTITDEQLTPDTSIAEEVNTVEEISADSSGKAEYEQGLAYAFGDGVSQNDRTAFNLFYAAAEKGYALAQYKVGVAFAYGEGVRQDPKLAAEWYLKAAEQGYTIAQRNLATMYLDGNGIQQNKIQALAWYRVVASQGNAMDIRRRDQLAKELSEIELSQSKELSNQITVRLSNNTSL